MSRIVTHPGGAHLDDLLSVALALGLDPAVERIERRPVAPGDLEDPDCWVLDQGRVIDPARRNFDHHQLPDGAPDCTFSLIADHCGLNPVLAECLWYEPARLLDSLGAVRAGEALGCPPRMVSALYTPCDEFFILRFSAAASLTPSDPLFGMLRDLGRDIVGGVTRTLERRALLEAKAEVLDVKGLRAILFFERVSEGTKEIGWLARKIGGAALSLTPDSRGDGWSLQRLEEHPRVDFRRVAGRPGVNFVHNTGFVAKCDALPREDLIRLLFDATEDAG